MSVLHAMLQYLTWGIVMVLLQNFLQMPEVMQ